MVAVRADYLVDRSWSPRRVVRPDLRLVAGELRLPVSRPPAEVASRPVAAHSLRAAPTTRTIRPSKAVYRRRRLVAAGLLLLAVAGLLIAAEAVIGRAGGGPLTTTGAGTASSASARVWVVQPGQTLWEIATAIDPGGDARPIVARLATETGSASVYPGERIAIP